MKRKLQFKNIFAIIAGIVFSVLLVFLVTSNLSYSQAKINLKTNSGVSFYLSGEYLDYDKSTNTYEATKDGTVRVVAVNDYMIATAKEDSNIVVDKQVTYDFSSSTSSGTNNYVLDENCTLTTSNASINNERVRISRTNRNGYATFQFNNVIKSISFDAQRSGNYTSLVVDGSTDGTDWTQVTTIANNELSTSEYNSFEIDMTNDGNLIYSYIRFTINAYWNDLQVYIDNLTFNYQGLGGNVMVKVYTEDAGGNQTIVAHSEDPILEFEAEAGVEYNVTANSTAITANTHGFSLSDPYIISSGEQLIALDKIFRGVAYTSLSANEQEIISALFTPVYDVSVLKKSYYRLTDNIILSANDFYGLYEFSGVFDFNNFSITINVVNTGTPKLSTDESQLNIGLFSSLVNNTTDHPCVIRNGKIRGSISFEDLGSTQINTKAINMGGLAGIASGNVIVDNISSAVAVSANDNVEIDIGGFFGESSINIDKKNQLQFNGVYSAVKAVSTGSTSSVRAGGFTGYVNNCYVHGYKDSSMETDIIAISEATNSGNVCAGGFIGVYENTSSSKYSTIKDISFENDSFYAISASMTNTTSNSSIASAGGAIGRVICGKRTEFDNITFKNKEPLTHLQYEINAYNTSANSYGNVYAGGVYGLVSNNNCYFAEVSDVTIFTNAQVLIKAEQNGHNQAYAGGMFAYNAFIKEGTDQFNINLNNDYNDMSFEVMAIQTAISNSVDIYAGPQLLSAGYFSSLLQENYTISGMNYTVNNGNLQARRQVGSTTFGAVYAGGFAGFASSDNDSSHYISDITLNLNDSTVAGLELSYESNSLNYGGDQANVGVGGFIGCIENYSNSNFTGAGIGDINVNVDLSREHEYVVKGIQNAKPQNASDHIVEGYVGGVVGYTVYSYYSNINFNGDDSYDTLITLDGTNNPNTISCGGIIGENNRNYNFTLNGASITNAHVVVSAYTSVANTSTSFNYDVFAGGVMGVLATDGGSNRYGTINNAIVNNVVVEALGENTMLTYAGGITGGAWWQGTMTISNCSVVDSTIFASSMASRSCSGGITGMINSTNTVSKVNSCYVIDTTVKGYSNDKEVAVAGINAFCESNNNPDGSSIQNCYSNAYLYAETAGTKSYYPIAEQGFRSYSNNYFAPFNIQDVVDGNAVNGIETISTTNNKHLALYLNDSKVYSSLNLINTNQHTVYNNYPGTPFSLSYRGDTDLLNCSENNNRVSMKNAASVGTVYADLYITVNGNKYLFSSMPIYLNGGNKTPSYTVLDKDNSNAQIANSSSDSLVSVNVGTSSKQNIRILFNGATPDYSLYSPAISNDTNLETFTGNLGSEVNVAYFSGKVDFTFGNEGSNGYIDLSVDPELLVRTPIVFSINGRYLVIDYIPNYVDYIELSPSEDTLSIDTIVQDGITYYVYAPGDTINIVSHETYVNGNVEESSVTTYTGNNHDGIATVSTNGTIKVDNDADSNDTFSVTGSYKGSLGDGSVDDKTIYFIIKSELTFTANITGASFESTRKVTSGVDFTFTVATSSGYGLDPDTFNIVIGSNTYDLKNKLVENIYTNSTKKYEGEIEPVAGVKFKYIYNAAADSYTITIPGSVITENITINVNFSLVSRIIFDRGSTYAHGGYERYYIYEVKSGTILDLDLYKAFDKNEIYVSRYGFSLEGYYLTDIGTSISSYGDCLYDDPDAKDIAAEDLDVSKLYGGGNFTINGPLYFYARWTYQAIIDVPDGVTVESTFPVGLLQEESDKVYLIPINANNTFSFKIVPDIGYEGMPDFKVYYIEEDGNEVEITDKCVENSSGGYDVPPEHIGGIIYVKVFSYSLVLNDGETESEVTTDSTIYSDSIFTINYSINYSSSGISVANSVSNNEIKIKFGHDNGSIENILPIDTTIRLYRHINGVAYDAYSYVLTEASSEISLNNFVNINNGSLLVNNKIPSESLMFSETYYFVITLPNHSTTYKVLTGSYVDIMASYTDNDNLNRLIYGLDSVPTNTDIINSNYVFSNYEYYDVKDAATFTVNDTDLTKLSFTVTYEDEEIRHDGKYYVWEVISTSELNETTISTIDECFTNGDTTGDNYRIVESLSRVYYIATSDVTINVSELSGYSIRLLEVDNQHTPASGVVVYEKTI